MNHLQYRAHQQRRPLSWLPQLHTMIEGALTLLFPPQCVGCRRWGWSLCPHCAQIVVPIGCHICEQCGRPQQQSVPQCRVCQQSTHVPATHRAEMIRVAAYHSEPMSQAIYGLKYRGKKELGPLLARYLVASLLDAPWAERYCTVDGIVPVPLHHTRRRERGYNHAELIAQAFCRQMELPLQSDWLIRRRATDTQVGLSAVERHSNVADAFVAHPAVKGKAIVVLDDVYTTGATLHSCATAFYAAGARVVYGLAVASPVAPASF